MRNGTAITGYKELSATTTVAEVTTSVELSNNDLIEMKVEIIEGTPKILIATLYSKYSH